MIDDRYPSRIIPNFLSDDEIKIIEDLTMQKGSVNIEGEPNSNYTHYNKISGFFLDRAEFAPVKQILEPRLREHFGQDLQLDASTHILEAYLPYNIHNDVVTAGFVPNETTDAAWTFIIPVADYDSHTVVFHQGHDHIKIPEEWIAKTNPQPHTEEIDWELHERYLSHCNPDFLRYLTIEDLFAWRKGALFAASRRKYHVSDNFPKNGLANKRAIVMWSSKPK